MFIINSDTLKRIIAKVGNLIDNDDVIKLNACEFQSANYREVFNSAVTNSNETFYIRFEMLKKLSKKLAKNYNVKFYNGKMIIKNVKFNAFEPIKFERINTRTHNNSFLINSELLSKKLMIVKSVINLSVPKNELRNVLFDMTNDTLKIVSTDTRRLSISKLDILNSIESSEKIMMNAKKLTAIIKLLKGVEGEIKVTFDKEFIIFEGGGMSFNVPVFAGSYPNYERIVPRLAGSIGTFISADVISIIDLVTINQGDIIFKNSGNGVLNISDVEQRISGAVETDNNSAFEFAFNSKYMIDFIKHFSNFELSFYKTNLPFMLDNGRDKMVIMPIVLRDD